MENVDLAFFLGGGRAGTQKLSPEVDISAGSFLLKQHLHLCSYYSKEVNTSAEKTQCNEK